MPRNPAYRRKLSFAERAYAVIRAIPRGRIASYGAVAAILGVPRAARAVGRALFELPEGSDVPWWRVVNRNGEISIKGTLHGPALQRALLRREGVKFDQRGRIDWRMFGWDGTGIPPGLRLDEPSREKEQWIQERRSVKGTTPGGRSSARSR